MFTSNQGGDYIHNIDANWILAGKTPEERVMDMEKSQPITPPENVAISEPKTKTDDILTIVETPEPAAKPTTCTDGRHNPCKKGEIVTLENFKAGLSEAPIEENIDGFARKGFITDDSIVKGLTIVRPIIKYNINGERNIAPFKKINTTLRYNCGSPNCDPPKIFSSN